MSKLKPAENPNYTGNLTINVTSSIGLIPINNATITISLKSTPLLVSWRISLERIPRL